MRVSCPNCATEYEVPDAALAGRSRKLRCDRCEHQWRVAGPAADFTPVAPAWPVDPVIAEPAPKSIFSAKAPLAEVAVVAAAEPEPVLTAPEPLPVFTAPEPEHHFMPVAPEPGPDIAPVTPPPGFALPEITLPEATLAEPPEADDTLPLPPRRFGQPVDEEAQAEIVQAVVAEEKHMPETAEAKPMLGEGLPAFLTAERGPDTVLADAAADKTEPDRFAELVYAARNKSIEYEPEPLPGGPVVRTSNSPLFVILVVALVIACVLVEHRNIIHLMPASAKFFGILGLK